MGRVLCDFVSDDLKAFAYDLYMVGLIICSMAYEKTRALKLKKTPDDMLGLVISAGLTVIVMSLVFFVAAAIALKADARTSYNEIFRVMRLCNGGAGQFHVNTFSMEREWPCATSIPLTTMEIVLGALSHPFVGDIRTLEDRNRDFMEAHELACAGPAAYGTPLNIISLARSKQVLYNSKIIESFGDFRLVNERSLSWKTTRSRLLLPHILVKHHYGVTNITDTDEAFCLQSYLGPAAKKVHTVTVA